ncbi:preprotein translocase subunit SecA [Akkermansia glycaniphila]|uniref:preprotein translocase subunit SecA n=1 Tax=Akkermansia glycaniphila TaxID=1679444 RepID=UPI001C028548|nr:preprotein translocase subunit SecA [Akkermansia glycaniphila]MBT9448976.1 preprotein translocase subunit SecA [Akkermansia glycaniphila]
MLKWILTKIVGSKNQREVRRLRPIVERIVALEESWGPVKQEFLVQKTRQWQAYLHRFTPLVLPPRSVISMASPEELAEWAEVLNKRFRSLDDVFPKLPTIAPTPESIEEGKVAFAEIEPRFDKIRAKYLEDILPEVFAAVKAGARAMKGSEIDVCGTKMKWDMVHFNVQLLGGIALHRGYIAEMATGEGKTLVATLPVVLNAMTGLGVHVVTVNDYLAKRDSMWMGALFQYLGLTVGCIQSMMPSDLRREQYNCDITYGTNAEFGFDYLRDNGMASSRKEQVQRGHYFAIIDEVDSILVDEARTPLIISGPAVLDREQQYDTLCPLIERVVKEQALLCNELMANGMEAAKEGRLEEAGRYFFKVKQGAPRNRQFMRAMEEPEYRRMLEKFETYLYQDTRKRELYQLKEELYFTVDEKTHDADLMEKGREVISPGNPEAFVLPDLGTELANMDENPRMTTAEKEARKRDLMQRLDETGVRLHTTSQLLKAYTIYEKDVEYVVREGKVIIIDQNTGREMPGRRWSDGLHQAVEAKEGVEVERENMTYATITIQNYFRLYKHLAGMTGTAETEAAEFHDIYKLDVLPIPTNRPCIRKDANDLIFKTRREKFNAVINKIQELHTKGQPMLIGTASVDASETLSRMLKRAKIPHEVLNAKNHQREADIIALAGQKGAVTVSTNMAGRGTDIKLGEGVAELGGLFVLGTERYESRRIDRQLRGRCSRQGDPGASQFFLSFEDDLMRNFGGAERMTKMMDRFGMKDGEAVENSLMNKIIEGAQKRVEQRNYMWRKHVLDYDDVMNKQREIVYGNRNNALTYEEPRELIYEILDEVVSRKCLEHLTPDEEGRTSEDELLQWCNSTFPLGWSAEETDFLNKSVDEAAAMIVGKVKETYELKVEHERAEHLDHMERQILLQAIDKHWQEHLTNMDALREGVRLRAQGQKDPLVEYKAEAYTMFENLITSIENETLNNLFRSTTNLDAFEDFLASLPQGNDENDNLEGSLNGLNGLFGGGDLLAALRNQMANLRGMQEQQDALPVAEHAEDESVYMSESISAVSDAVPSFGTEKPMTLPKRKISVNIKREPGSEAPVSVDEKDVEGEEAEPSETLGSMDSGSMGDSSPFTR